MPDTSAVQFPPLAAAAALIGILALVWLASYGVLLLVIGQAPKITGWIRSAGNLPPVSNARTWIARRYPRLAAFASARFDTARFAGLPLTLLVIAALYTALLFAGLIENVLEAEEIRAADEAIASLLGLLRTPEIVGFFSAITHAGDLATLAIVTAVATGFLWAHGPDRYITPLWIAIAGSQITTWTGKFVLYRPRPEFVLDVTAWSPSFPSAHATGAMAVYGLVAYVIARDLPTVRQRFEVAFWTAVLIAAVAVSRVLLSVHHPSDVAAGLLVGIFWMIVGIAIAEFGRRRSSSPS